MIKRYSDERIAAAWSLPRKYELWQKVEIVVPEARAVLGRIPAQQALRLRKILSSKPISERRIETLEKKTRHDLNAFLEERMRFLTDKLQRLFHALMTSYDTEESAFVLTLIFSCRVVIEEINNLLVVLKELALRYRYTPMNARTHGQEAELQSFGKRVLTWYTDLAAALETLTRAMENLMYSKLSGAIGTHSGIDPQLEKTALKILGLKPWMGATQIMPRVLYSPIASALADIASVMDKIAIDIRLGARSGRPIYHEPFSAKQKGSSAMPHKKNTILTENTAGMARMARAYASGIRENIVTWEERAIEQSSVERVFWPDLFHVTLFALKNILRVTRGLVVYPDNMITEIIESRGTYASSTAKELLTEVGAKIGLSRENAYRLVQLAAFTAFNPSHYARSVRETILSCGEQADDALDMMGNPSNVVKIHNIQHIIAGGHLTVHPDLAVSDRKVKEWNEKLSNFFRTKPAYRSKWADLFRPSKIMANERYLFEQVFGV